MSRYVPAAGTIRRIRGLYELGHDADTIAATTGVPADAVALLAGPHHRRRPGTPDDVIHREVAAAVAAAAAHLSRLPGRSAAARARALHAGWAPLRAWDGALFDIDDPAADEQLAARTTGMHPSLRRAVLDEHRAAAAVRARCSAASRRNMATARTSRWTHTPTPATERSSA